MSKFLVLFLMSLTLNAAEFTVKNPCSTTPILEVEIDATKYETVGDLTVHLLNKNRIPYQGNERGMNQILNSPLGLDALDVVSDTVMFAYGWCYRVNGVIPDVFAEDVYLDESIKTIEWFYGYSEFRVNAWVSMCIPPETRDNSFICKK